MRDLITLVLRDGSRHAGFGMIYLANRFRDVSAAERARFERLRRRPLAAVPRYA
jgi:hypothetical protein